MALKEKRISEFSLPSLLQTILLLTSFMISICAHEMIDNINYLPSVLINDHR